ncbi:F-box protein at1g70590 [Phtheirospermum japonicum]|uniref:F-box protein at1g70590 n=1 Tax=Phtheirospermum japonicum TaxID=374723 RepID=A0A830B4S8_9LAMI|nr:F-box protein at1g70590 [Phtheirospermum japonicum]
MKQKSRPSKSDNSPFTALPFIKKHHKCPTSTKSSKTRDSHSNPTEKHQSSVSSSSCSDFSSLPYDVLAKIAAPFALPNLRAASLVCRAWRDALEPLREAMVLLMWGKRFKHGRGGVKANLGKALDSFLEGAARGSTLAMVDAGLLYWEMGEKEEAVVWYRKAAEFGDVAGQCNLAIAILEADCPNSKEAIELLYKASVAGHARAQYQLALCLHQGRGVEKSLQQAARWYQRAAMGGYARAMYNTSLCYTLGEGLWQSYSLGKKWMARAADCGHSKAQFEHGLTLSLEGDMTNAVVYLELATRAGETDATRMKNTILQQLSEASRAKAMLLADRWRALPSSH